MCDKTTIIGQVDQLTDASITDPELVPTFYLRDEGGDVLVKRKDDQGDSRFVAMFFQDPHDSGQARELAEEYVELMNRKIVLMEIPEVKALPNQGGPFAFAAAERNRE